MIRQELRDFVEDVTGQGFISPDHVQSLRTCVLGSGVASRREIEALLLLHRTIEAHESWCETLSALVVDFVVWRSGAKGVVTNEDAMWLTTTLEVSGHSPVAMIIAYGILDQASHVDAALLDFIMRGRQQARAQSLAA
ncbi:hypothetical protein [Microvirga flavescens]|uniref:hypothetical protein n=1 Tax=Microvirga flavescens TaxID=2249811 RepID=UPI000DD5329A|nr:hypothetical protein [Microvirga flavescens]